MIATHVPASALSDAEVFQTYKNQSTVEHGFRFLKDPLFFVSSLFLKKPSRLQGLLMVITLALLVYAIAQRRLRARLAQTNETLPNQINVPTKTPTLRWAFQMLEGIHRVVMMEGSIRKTFIEGLTTLRQKILRLFGNTACRHHEISWAENGTMSASGDASEGLLCRLDVLPDRFMNAALDASIGTSSFWFETNKRLKRSVDADFIHSRGLGDVLNCGVFRGVA